VDVRWLALGVVPFIGVAVLVVKKAARKAPTDLGSVSNEWIAQHRRR